MNILIFLFPLLFLTTSASAKIISIDVGHFNEKPGAVSAYGETELMYNQLMAVNLYQEISKVGYKVQVQGMEGNLKSLTERSKMSQNSDFFLSIHHDSVQENDLTPWVYNGKKERYTQKANGFSIFLSEDNPQYAKAHLCAKKIANNLIDAGFSPNFYHHFNNPRGNFKLLYKDLPVYNFNKLVVLKTNKVPAILLEAGVILNPLDANALKDDNIRTRFAIAVAYGLRNCIK